MSNLIKIRTIDERHVRQLAIEHYWHGEYDFTGKEIIGRLVACGSLLVRDEHGLHRISAIAFLDWQLEVSGCRKKVSGEWVYVPTPHTPYAEQARKAYDAIPELFLD